MVTYIFQLPRGDYPVGVIDYLEKHPGPEYTATFQGIDYAKVYPAPRAQYIAASELTGISTLLGYSLDKQKVAAGDSLQIKLYWENDGRIEHDMFVQLTDPDHYIWNETSASFSPGFEGLTDQPGAIIEGEAKLSIPVDMPPGLYDLKMGYKTEDRQLIGQFQLPSNGDMIEVTLPETFITKPAPSHAINLEIDEALILAGYDLDREQVSSGESVWLTLYWQALQDVKQDYVVNLRLLSPTGAEVAYRLGRPARSSLPTNLWQEGQIVQDPWSLTIPGESTPGVYQLEIVIFDAETQQETRRTFLQSITITITQLR